MTHTVEIESTRAMDVQALLAALSSEGLAGEVVEAERRCRLYVEADDDARVDAVVEVEHAIERWLDERHVDLVPQRVGEGTLLLRPPMA